MQVAVRYRRNVGRLSIDMSANCWTTTLGLHIGQVSAEMSADISVDMSVNMSTDISVEHWSICRPTLDRYVGQYVDRYIGRGVHKIHMVPKYLCQNNT